MKCIFSFNRKKTHLPCFQSYHGFFWSQLKGCTVSDIDHNAYQPPRKHIPNNRPTKGKLFAADFGDMTYFLASGCGRAGDWVSGIVLSEWVAGRRPEPGVEAMRAAMVSPG